MYVVRFCLFTKKNWHIIVGQYQTKVNTVQCAYGHYTARIAKREQYLLILSLLVVLNQFIIFLVILIIAKQIMLRQNAWHTKDRFGMLYYIYNFKFVQVGCFRTEKYKKEFMDDSR